MFFSIINMTVKKGENMNLDNGRISQRQAFRIGVLENIAVAIVVIPYITVNVAGRLHFCAFLAGLLMSFIYASILFFYTKKMPDGVLEGINIAFGRFAKVVDVVYVMRYVLRVAIILMFFGTVIKEYMLKDLNIWLLVVPFAFVCGYGALRDIEKRGRLLELLFWWMIVPLILVAVFSITNIRWREIPGQIFGLQNDTISSGSISEVLFAGYLVALVLSSCELLMFTVTKQKTNSWRNAVKTIVWIFIAVLFAYLFIIGILGGRWVAQSATTALNVMEASAFPGGLIERMDYPVLSFWIIGMFATISGYMFYAKEFAGELFETTKETTISLLMLVIVALVIVVAVGIYIWNFPKWIAWYMVWGDLLISLVVPFVELIIKSVKE